MKKFLSTFLAILMVFSMVATTMVTAFAAEAEEVHSILVTNGEDLAEKQTEGNGWRNHKINLTIEEVDGQKAAACKVVGPKALTDVRFHYGSATTVDTTKFTHVEFDLYVGDASKLPEGYVLNVELSSAGVQDTDEMAKTINNAGLQTGWNHIKLALADVNEATGNYNPAAWNFVRVFFSTGNFVLGETEELILAIDNFGFSDGTETPAEKEEVVEPVNPLAPVVKPTEIIVWDGAETEVKVGNSVGDDGWHPGLKLTEIGEDKRLAAAATLTGNGNHAGSMVYLYQGKTPVDVSGMKYVEFDFYISDVEMLNTDTFCLELTSSGAPDVEETACEFRYDFVNGWNHVKVDFTDATFMAATGGTFDATQFDCFRFFTTANLACGEDKLVIAVDDLKFTPAGTNPQVVDVPEYEGAIKGWSAAATNWTALGSLAGKNGVYAATFDAGEIGATRMLIQYNFGGKIAPIDISAMTHLEFDFYVSDPATMAGQSICLELTSGGQADKGEINWANDLNNLVEGGLKAGWNTVKLEIASMGHHDNQFDATKWNFFRFHNTGAINAASDLTIAIDNLRFTKEGADTITASSCEAVTNGWTSHAAPIMIDGKVAMGHTYTSNLDGAGAMYIQFIAEKSLNISGMRFLEFDLYISDAAAWEKSNIVLEISSYGDCDKQERSREFNPWTGLVDGWNHIVLHIGSQLNGTNNDKGPFSPVRFNYIRLFNQTAVPVKDELTVALKNVEFTTRQDNLDVNEYGDFADDVENITFTTQFGDLLDENNNNSRLPEGDPTIPSFYYKWNNVGINSQKYYADVGKYVSFKLDVENWKTAKSVKFTGYFGAQLLLKVSTDGENWTEVFRCKDVIEEGNGGTTSRGIVEGYYTFDITDAVFGEDGKMNGPTVYIMVDDAYPKQGWGGNFFHGKPATLSVTYVKPAHEYKIPVPGTTVPGWPWSADFTLNSTVSISNTYKANAHFAFCDLYVGYNLPKPVNATGAKEFVFDFYASDVAGIKDATVEIEVTSGGTCDSHEKCYVGSLDAVIKGGMKPGWNTVVIPVDKMSEVGGAIDWSKVDFFRIYNQDAGGQFDIGDADLTLAIDNLRFTTDDKDIVLDAVNPDMMGWDAGTTIMDLNGNIVLGNTVSGKFDICAIYLQYCAEKGVDVSSMKYLEYDLYITDVDAIKNVVLRTEINSSGDYDKAELGYDKTVADYGLKDGWNRIRIELDKMGDTAGNGACDLTDIKWFRLFTTDIVDSIDEITYAVTNIRFADDKAPAMDTPANPEGIGPDQPDVPDVPDVPVDPNKQSIVVPMDGVWTECDFMESFKDKANVRYRGFWTAGSSHNAGGFMFSYGEGKKAEAIDISNMEFLEFDVYVSDVAAIADVEFSFELTSGGTADKEESARKFKGKDTGWVNGWNHVKWNLKEFSVANGTFDPTRWNYIRWYNDTKLTVGEYLEVAITNVEFTSYKAADDESVKEDKYIFDMFSDEEKKYLDPDFQGNNANNEVRFADASAYFIYKYDLKSFRGVQSISFEGNIGGQLHLWASADGKNWVEIEKHEVRFDAKYMNIDLSVMAEAVAETMTLYIKIGDAVTTDGNGGQIRKGQVHLTVVYDANADQKPIEKPPVTTEHEKYEFSIGTEEEGKYLLNEGNSVLKTPDHDRRYADQTRYFIYKYEVKNIYQIETITFKAKAEAQMKLQVSVDKENWIDIDLSEYGITKPGDRLGTGVYKFDITAVAEKLSESAKTIYVKISDNKTEDGYGGCLVTDTPVVLDIEYTPLTDAQKDELEATVTEHSIPLWGANKTWGDIYVVDNENQVAGSGCISANLKGVSGTHAPSKKFDTPIDASGMDTFEFNLYLSDLAIVDHLKNNIGSGSVELCSGGACDQAEKAVHLHQIFTDFVVGELTVGWNQIAIPLNKMASTPGNAGEFQITGINYIRIFWSGMTNPTDQDWIIKFDNFRMTDRQAENDRQQQIFIEATLEKYAGLIKNIESLKPIYEAGLTAENFNGFKVKYSESKAAFDAATEEEQAVMTEYKVMLNKAKNAIDAYQEKVDALEANAQLIADLQALAAYKEASAFTYENYDDAKAAIEAARAAVDALERKVRELLSDEGYIDFLTAAEDAMPEQKPEAPKTECTEHVDADNNGKCDNCDADVEKDPGTTPGTENPGGEQPKEEDGCKSALTIGALATMILAGAWVTIAARKKED